MLDKQVSHFNKYVIVTRNKYLREFSFPLRYAHLKNNTSVQFRLDNPGMVHLQQGCTHTTICLYCRYTIILAIRSAVPIPIPIFMASCIKLHDIIVLSSNYCIPYMGKPVHMHACHMHAKLDSLKGFLWCDKPI